MGNYPTYKKYKQTRCAWLQEIPEHWDFKRLKNVASHNDEALDERTDPDLEIEYVDISSVSLVNGIEKTEAMPFEKAPSRARRKVKDGDIIVSTVRTYLKAIAPICEPSENMVVSTGFAVIRPKENLLSGFAGYLLQSNGFVGDVVANSVGVSYPAINASDLVRIPAVEPPLEEQKAIARFLDFKTAQIDALIAKKKALLDKLAEKRTALISHAVTKGLDPSVPMKESGVEWLGKIPKGWKSISVRWLIRVGSGDFISNTDTEFDCSDEAPVPVVGGNGVMAYTNQVNTQNDCIVIGRVGAHCGNVHFIKAPSWITDNALRVKIISDDISAEFLICALKAIGLNDFANKNAQPLITGEMVKSKDIALPPMADQIEICRHIDKIEAHIKSQTEKTQLAIDKLREYRGALITNAVIGKIDVRGFQVPKLNAEVAL